MAKWGEYTHEAVLVAAENLVNLSTELRDRLSGQAKELSHDDAEFFLRKIIGMAEFMSGTVAGKKVRRLLSACHKRMKTVWRRATAHRQANRDEIRFKPGLSAWCAAIWR
jgi:hypothetical protein